MAFGFFEDWKDKLIPASFRGIPFFIFKSSASFGRRAKIWHRWPSGVRRAAATTGKIEPLTQDFGQLPDEFTVEGYVIANADNDYDYFTNKEDLIDALKGSPDDPSASGVLAHPYYGYIDVLVKDAATVEETTEEGGIARFTMHFVQFGASIFPGDSTDYTALVDASLLEMILEFKDSFLSTFNAVGAFVTATINDIGNLITSVVTAINAISFGLTSLVNGIINGILNIANSISGLLDAPCNIADAFFDSVDSVKGLTGQIEDVEFGGVLGGCSGEQRGDTTTLTGETIPASLGSSIVNALLNQIGLDDVELSTTTTEQAENQSISIDMMKGAMFANIVSICIRIDFKSVQAANAFRDSVADALDDFLIRLGGLTYSYATDMYLKVENVRNVFVKSMTGKFQNAAREIDYRVSPDIQTTLEVAYEKYEDLDRADEIFDRNTPTVRHPGFLPNQELIKVLNE